MRGFMVASGNFFFRYRNFLFPVVFLAFAGALMPGLPGAAGERDVVMDIAGAAIALAGQSLRFAVIGFAYVKRGGKNKRVYADTLVQEGFFAHARNPLYVGNILVLLGLIVIHGSPWFLVFGSAFFLFAYLAITAAEEEFLGKKFGEQYAEYCRRVPRFFLRMAGLRASLQGMSFDWRRVIRKEYGSTFTWVVAALALIVWERYRRGGTDSIAGIEAFVIAGFAVVLTAYVAARILKKTGHLGHD